MHLVRDTQPGYAKFPPGVAYLDRAAAEKVIRLPFNRRSN
jgi:hypothetical protein